MIPNVPWSQQQLSQIHNCVKQSKDTTFKYLSGKQKLVWSFQFCKIMSWHAFIIASVNQSINVSTIFYIKIKHYIPNLLQTLDPYIHLPTWSPHLYAEKAVFKHTRQILNSSLQHAFLGFSTWQLDTPWWYDGWHLHHLFPGLKTSPCSWPFFFTFHI